MAFLNLIRYKNLLMIALMQVFVKYGLLSRLDIPLTLSDLQFILLVVATLCVAAAGNVINDIYDTEIDAINKPDKLIVGNTISEKNAHIIYIVLTVLGVLIGFYLSNDIDRSGFASIFIVVSALLYIYASYLKGMLIVGNLIISSLVGLSIVIVGVFDIIPAIRFNFMEMQAHAMAVIMHYAFFAFLINLNREIVKDIQDVNGDKKGGMNTLAIAIGRDRTVMVAFILGVITVLIVIYYMYIYLYINQYIVLYFLFLIVAPLFYYCIKAYSAESQKDYRFLSVLLKLIMFLGMCSLLLYPSVILY